jgi:hypothetical protein
MRRLLCQKEWKTISTAIINKVGTNEIFMSKSIAFRCQTCGNIQTFVEEEFHV